MRRIFVPALLVAAAAVSVSPPVVGSAVPVAAAGEARSMVVRYVAPVPGRVLRGFSMPAGPFGPGHRGVDLAAAEGARVGSAADGTITFAGSVAGRGVVVVAHADGVRTEYEPVRASVRRGDMVRRGAALGVVAERHGSCAPAACLHWGARRGLGRTGYLDPLLLLRPLGPVRLLPWPR